ncbi:hypothetical protein NFI96_019936 [Prochilodus magdalenae]|nr:hypothetical protein NFI96_019936 [Prochilodus magdalenae]
MTHGGHHCSLDVCNGGCWVSQHDKHHVTWFSLLVPDQSKGIGNCSVINRTINYPASVLHHHVIQLSSEHSNTGGGGARQRQPVSARDVTSAILKYFPFPLFPSSVIRTAAGGTPAPSGSRSSHLADMEIDTLLEALKDFDKKGKKEVSPVLDQFLCHVAKTGETMVSWSQFKNYFLFKLEKVMEDFRASAPEQRGPANPNVESVPFEEMKERILKIVNGYNGIPFTIQRLCELLTDPKRNYTGTEKFLRGVEKNVMVVSCVYPTSDRKDAQDFFFFSFRKNGCSGVNRMNGVMLPGNTSVFTERKVNGPGTPRPLNRPKLSSSTSLATNGLPDSTENKDSGTSTGHSKLISDSSVSGNSPSGSVKNKHADEEEGMEGEQQEVKRLKFSEDGAEEEEDDDVEDEPSSEAPRPAPAESASDAQESDSPSSMTEEKDDGREEEDSEAATSTAGCEDQEPSSTQSDCAPADEQEGCSDEREVPCGSTSPTEEPCDMDQSEQQAPASSPEQREEEEPSEPVSSSSSGGESSESSSSCNESSSGQTPSSSAADSPTEGDVESGELDSENTEEPMEQD